ncbi:conserved hypothetical protein [Ricinus communis]|uniref:Uncharacterized protein n=1 Tax=Ricinus communis TaxID=3988 RepID=B9S2L4_RICCO|nr:conserved hypothetical protein [Ricinus communis]
MAFAWSPVCGVTIKDLGKQPYLFKLYHELDYPGLLNGMSWTSVGFRVMSSRN